MPPEAMITQMRKRLWDVGVGMRPLCPSCASERATPLPKPDNQTFDQFIPPPPATAIYHSLLTAAEKITRRAVMTDALHVAEGAVVEAEKILQERQQDAEEQRRQEWQAKKEERKARREAKRAERVAQEGARFRVVAQNVEKTVKEEPMSNIPSMKITHQVFQLLDSVFDPVKRMYRTSYSDERVAKDCGTTTEIVVNLRREVYGELAEDPRLQTIRDDIELFRMQVEEFNKNAMATVRDLQSRVDQMRANTQR